MRKEFLRVDANVIRQTYIKKPFPKSNVAIVEIYLNDKRSFAIGATSKAKSPTPLPKPKSKGGQFEPTIDSYSRRIMDTDSEYKALSALADVLDSFPKNQQRGKLYL